MDVSGGERGNIVCNVTMGWISMWFEHCALVGNIVICNHQGPRFVSNEQVYMWWLEWPLKMASLCHVVKSPVTG